MAWDGTFSLTETEDGSAGFVSVPAEDVLFFSFVRNQVLAHTEHMEFFAGWDSLDRLWKAIQGVDSRFYRTDRNYIANLSKIRKLDFEWCKGYFEEHPSSRSKFCYIARVRIKEVRKRLALFNASDSKADTE